jgi:hypothetical protein
MIATLVIKQGARKQTRVEPYRLSSDEIGVNKAVELCKLSD